MNDTNQMNNQLSCCGNSICSSTTNGSDSSQSKTRSFVVYDTEIIGFNFHCTILCIMWIGETKRKNSFWNFTLKNESGLQILSINVNGNKRYGPRGSLLALTLKTISSGIIKRLSFHDCDINISAT
ncbi:hypothetical protein DERP_011751 [Dermatophagoides pteronyssinus]|uniref:Uncharacterized protein n=1 Tax=Dermatophagoides pteronyssinus TaxID=6956 RepID=A0ABQ8J368_DERPT|nr:hypothetical protein DERP_011751 [Dermatophagoides pteronyssinus]